MRVFTAKTLDEIGQIRVLFREYEAFLNVDLCFQRFEEELRTLPGDYAPPTGRLLLATIQEHAAGCVALRALEPGICEMKRLFVRPHYRGNHIGRKLVERIIEEAYLIGYSRMRLDSLRHLDAALKLYTSLGFQEIAPYYNNPLPDVVYLERVLT
jgi:GNAT superfamily N-acetyltransferase